MTAAAPSDDAEPTPSPAAPVPERGSFPASRYISAYGPLLETQLRVVSYNLWWRFAPDDELTHDRRLPAIIETLRRVDPDVVGLQEVWVDRETGDSSAARIAEALGYHHVLTERVELDGYGFGNAVLSRWPITGTDWRPLPSPPELDEFRTVLRADVDGPRGPMQVFSTHLHWRFDHSGIRQDQVRAICEFIAESPKRTAMPPILCGDFNADPDSDEIRMLRGASAPPVPKLVFHDAWHAAPEKLGPTASDGSSTSAPGITWSNDQPYAGRDLEPDRRLDYVFVGWPKAGGAGQVRRAEVIGVDPVDVGDPLGPIYPSDHYGLAVDLRY